MRCNVTTRLLTIFALTGLASAQQTDASISGIVSDAHDAAIIGAKVVAETAGTGVRTTAQTNHTCFYSLRPLPIGPYVITVEQAGFRRYERSGIVLNTGLALELNVTLEVGTVSESVTVTSQAPLLDARSWETSQTIESKNIEELP